MLLVSFAFAAELLDVNQPPVLTPHADPDDVALILYVDDYIDTGVTDPLFVREDAAAWEAQLRAAGIDRVTVVRSPTRDAAKGAIEAAARAAAKGDVWLVFLGHATSARLANGHVEQVLVFSDAPASAGDYGPWGISESELWRDLGGVPARVFVDGCFDGTGLVDGRRANSRPVATTRTTRRRRRARRCCEPRLRGSWRCRFGRRSMGSARFCCSPAAAASRTAR